MKKEFKAILLIYLNISLTSIKIVQTANRDVKNPCEDFHEYACSNNSTEMLLKLEDQVNEQLLSFLNSLIPVKQLNFETFYGKIFTYFEACKNYNNIPNDEYWSPIDDLMKLGTYNFWPMLGIIQSYGFNNVIINHSITRNMDNTLNIRLSAEDIEENDTLDSDDPDLLIIFENKKARETFHKMYLKWRDTISEHKQMKYDAELKIDLKKNKNLSAFKGLHSYLQNLLEADIDNISVITIDEKYYEFLIEIESNFEKRAEICIYMINLFRIYMMRDGLKNFEPLSCVNDLKNKFELGLNYIYYKNFFQWKEDLYKVMSFAMLERITTVMSEEFKSNHLNLSSKQIEFLLHKLKSVRLNIGNMPDNFSYMQINNFYQDIPKLNSSNYCKNHLMLLKHRFRKSLDYTQNQTYSTAIDGTTPIVPFYEPNKNMFVIPYGIFQLPLIDYKQTDLEKVSVFGFVVAHELTHAFDTLGLHFDHQGSFLIQPSDILEHANFMASKRCMQEQEPTEYIHERMADLFAVRVVYRTYLKYYAKVQEKDWSKEFFEHMAQFFCGEKDLNYIDHDSDPVRLRQIVKNFPPFAQAFACPADSAMNLKSKCRLY